MRTNSPFWLRDENQVSKSCTQKRRTSHQGKTTPHPISRGLTSAQ